MRSRRNLLMFNCKMTDELTMATAEDLLLIEKVRKESEPKNQKNSKETGLRLIEKVRKESVPRNQKNSKETGLKLIEKERTESVPRNYQSNAEADLLLKEKVKKRRRAEELQEQQEIRLAADRESKKRKRAEESEQPESYRLAFRYNPVDDYSLSRCVQIGTMSKICPYCKALKFNGEMILIKLLFPLTKRLLANMCVDTMLQLSTKWQSLWSVISFYLEILFFISETLSW